MPRLQGRNHTWYQFQKPTRVAKSRNTFNLLYHLSSEILLPLPHRTPWTYTISTFIAITIYLERKTHSHAWYVIPNTLFLSSSSSIPLSNLRTSLSSNTLIWQPILGNLPTSCFLSFCLNYVLSLHVWSWCCVFWSAVCFWFCLAVAIGPSFSSKNIARNFLQAKAKGSERVNPYNESKALKIG